jgi:hypothetical protein
MNASFKFVAPPLTVITLSAAVFFAPSAAAQPQCDSISAQTTQCTTAGGSHRIVTGPPELGSPTWPGFTYRYWDSPNYIVQFP